jgi:uncharacterized membrane protein HdeD (DUF308 family)
MSEGSTGPVGTGGGVQHRYISRHFVVAGEELRQASGWLLFLGAVLIFLGLLALLAPLVATGVLVTFYGFVLLFGGITHAVTAIAAWRWGGFFLHVLAAVIDVVLGLMFLRHPDVAASLLTLLLIVGFLLGGIFRLVVAISLRFPAWGWTVLSGVITFAVGVLLWVQWPWDSLVIPGLFLGIQMLFFGWSAVMLALAARSS